jgi:hypothetical protein
MIKEEKLAFDPSETSDPSGYIRLGWTKIDTERTG